MIIPRTIKFNSVAPAKAVIKPIPTVVDLLIQSGTNLNINLLICGIIPIKANEIPDMITILLPAALWRPFNVINYNVSVRG